MLSDVKSTPGSNAVLGVLFLHMVRLLGVVCGGRPLFGDVGTLLLRKLCLAAAIVDLGVVLARARFV